MKKVVVVFLLAVFAPSLVLAWLAVRSARDQQIVVQQQQSLLYQGVADAVAQEVRDYMAGQQREFAQFVERMRRDHSTPELAKQFDALCVKGCASAEVGFTVSSGEILSPSLFDRPEARQFRLNNDRFLGSCETVEVYWSSPKDGGALGGLGKSDAKAAQGVGLKFRENKNDLVLSSNLIVMKEVPDSKVTPDEAEFQELIGTRYEGTIARFLQNKLKLLLWYRSVREPDIVYGAQLNLSNIVSGLQPLIRPPPSVGADAAVALINDAGRVVAGRAAGSKPFVASEIGAVLPHWKVGVYLNHPEALTRSARTVKLALTLAVVAMIAAIALGSLLIGLDLRRQLTLARQKTDFVSNVSHELKTPLTSIRMFTELLSEGKVADEKQRKHFLGIIAGETARLTRLINNVLDFARMERGEREYQFERCDLKQIVRATVESCRPQLEARGLTVHLRLPDHPVEVRGDGDALAQVLVNLLSNAEKYATGGGEVAVELERRLPARREGSTNNDHAVLEAGAPMAQLRVMDRGPGVPRGCEEKIFEQFYRANDSLSSGVQGSGLGLTLARQIARAHGGDIGYEPREGGGSCFVVSLPLA